MAKFSCEIKKLLVLGADPKFLQKKRVLDLLTYWIYELLNCTKNMKI